MLTLERRRRRRSLRLLGWSSRALLAVLLNASGVTSGWVRHFSFRSKFTIRNRPHRTPLFAFGAIWPDQFPAYQRWKRKNQGESEGSAAKQLTDDLGGIVDHRHDAGVVEPGRSDDAENADDLPGRVVIRRNDGGRAGQRKQLVFRTDKHPHALGLLGAAKQIDHLAPGFKIVEQQPHAFEIG